MVEKIETTTQANLSLGQHEFIQKSPDDILIKTATTNRPVGFLENWFSHNRFTLVSIAHFTLKERQEMDMDLLKKACDFVSDRHPILKCHLDHHKIRRNCFIEIQDADRCYITPQFMPHDHLMTKLEKNKNDVYMKSYSNENAWLWMAEKELNVDFEVNLDHPLWRLTLLQWNTPGEYYMFVSMPHAISDLTSMDQVIKEILQYYEKLLSNSIQSVEPLPMLPDAEQLHFMSNKKMDEKFVKDSSVEALDKFLQYSPRIQLIDNASSSLGDVTVHNHCKPLVAVGDPSNYKLLKEKLYSECFLSAMPVTIACAWLTLAKYQMSDDFSGHELSTSLDYMINIRNFVKPRLSTDHLGLVSGIIRFDQSTTSNVKFWDYCQCIQNELEQALEEEEPMYWTAIQRTMGHDSVQFVEHLRENKGRYGDLIMCDRGGDFNLTFDTFDVASINTLFGNRPNGWGFSLNVNRLPTRASYSWTFDRAIVNEEYASQVFQHFVSMIENIHTIPRNATIGDVLRQNCSMNESKEAE